MAYGIRAGRRINMESPAPIWDDGGGIGYPELRGHAHADVCVVGLGGSGLACIDELLSAGVTVVGLDAGRVAGEAAGRNGGLLRAGLALFHHEARARYGVARAASLYAATLDERERLLRKLPAIVRRCGYARLAHDAAEARDCRAHLDALREDGFHAEWYAGPAGSALVVPHDAAVNPMARCRVEAADVASRGAQLHEHSSAVKIGSGWVETGAARVTCRVVIVAVDGGLARVLPELGERVRPARLQMLGATIPAHAALPAAGGTPWGWDYWRRLDDGRIAFGGCRDAGGDAEWTDDSAVSVPVQTALEHRFEDVTGARPVVTHRWAATVGYTEDGLPVVEEVRPGVWAVGGYSGTGNLLGAVCGRAAARMSLGLTSESPLD